ncbi:hypothetical protein DQ244_10960 [Blastococcus sp. TBT05-19]|uniref:Rv3235 family protein n=1 Tax=Blastococcus sp. TBT05-19 TaxID=2250581 RepID=UPI000DE95E23|nr:Rv3235 family protein [Blastococcus sp. TBT05-19]RBY91794.1 hypothetical protein DQ244_10960 [Blastococcus sp. TBT05-19]
MTAPTRTAPPVARPALRLTVVPTPQPPLQERTPLRLVEPDRAIPRPVHRPGPPPRQAITGMPADEFGPVRSTRADLPPAVEAGHRLVRTTLEALAGRRPLAHVRDLTSPGIYAALVGGRRPAWCAEGSAPLVVGRMRVCEPVDGVAEISAVAHRGGRAHAVAARLEGIDGRWRCTVLQVG